MAIKRNVKVVITEDISKVSEKLYIYQHDRGIDITFDITENKFEFYKRVEKSIIDDNIMYASITIVKPDGTAFKREMLPIEENKVVFRVEHEHTDDFAEIGIYTLQAHLHDEEGNRVTIPPVILEVKELIADLDCNSEAKTDMAMVGVATVAEENILFTIENGYIKTNWKSGDIITASKLNKIEEALFETVEKVNSLEVTGGGGTGEAGKDGVDGKSAYEIAVEEGFVGSQTEWLASLKGEKGEQGLQGLPGEKGEKGDTGAKGEQGLKGEKGEAGEQGPIGPQGPQGIQGEKGEKGDPGIQGERGEQGLPGERGEQGLPGQDGRDGADGKSVELQKSSTHVQWRLVGESSWNNLIALTDLKGEKGEQGLQGEKGEQGLAGEPGAKGEPGEAGRDGQDGKSVELQKTETHIQWRLVGEEAWVNLIALEELVVKDESSSNVDLTNYYTKEEVDKKTNSYKGEIGYSEYKVKPEGFDEKFEKLLENPKAIYPNMQGNVVGYIQGTISRQTGTNSSGTRAPGVILFTDKGNFYNALRPTITNSKAINREFDVIELKTMSGGTISSSNRNSMSYPCIISPTTGEFIEGYQPSSSYGYTVTDYYYSTVDIYNSDGTIAYPACQGELPIKYNDCNDAIEEGSYKVNIKEGEVVANTPFNGAISGILKVSEANNVIYQELIENTGKSHTRIFINNAWSEWKSGGAVDLSNYITTEDLDKAMSEIDLVDYYTKEEADNRIDEKISQIEIPEIQEVDLSNYYTKNEVDELIESKTGGSGNVDLSEIEEKIDNINAMLETTRASLVIDINKLVNLI